MDLDPKACQTFYLLSLGCSKNLVDAECMSKVLALQGLKSVSRPQDAQVLIVNTCGFIEAAKEEAIDAILDLAAYKKPAGAADHLIVTGCLSQRYAREILTELPEVDALLGTADYGLIGQLITQLQAGQKPDRLPGAPGSLAHLAVERQPSTRHFAWLKIAEGCSSACSYCAIPGMRGPLRSRPLEDIVAEASRLSQAGYGELILIAQDTGAYGMDRYGRRRLADLIQALCRLPDVRLVRTLYTYARGVTDQLIQVLKDEEKAAPYLDIPIQHTSDRLLKAMNRPDRADSLKQLFKRLRQDVPGLILRSTVMVGFPTETDADFEALLAFIREVRFDRLGCFIFSKEEGTAAEHLQPAVDPGLAQARYDQLMALQQDIARQAAQNRVGTELAVTLESTDDRGIFYIGRSYGEAPDTDPVIYVAASDASVRLGQTRRVRLVTADAYELTGVTVS